MVNGPVRLANVLLVLSSMLMVGWGLGLLGYINMRVAWWLLVVAWGLFMFWCYGWYVAQRHERLAARRDRQRTV